MPDIQDESEFENSPYVGQSPPSPSNQMRTPSDSNKKDYSKGSPIVSPSKLASPSSTVAIGSRKTLDRINNLVQKEESLSKAGVTRYKYMLRIAEALDAVIEYEVRSADGVPEKRTRPDVARNQWGVEQAAKLYGDMIERKEIEHDLGESTLARFKSLSVAELKARAADLLLGKPVSRLGPVVDVEGGPSV